MFGQTTLQRASGPPSKPGRTPPPERAFCPLWPLPDKYHPGQSPGHGQPFFFVCVPRERDKDHAIAFIIPPVDFLFHYGHQMWNLFDYSPDRRVSLNVPDFLHPRKTKRIKHFALVGSSSMRERTNLTFNGIHGYFLGASNFIPARMKRRLRFEVLPDPAHSRA